MNMHRVALAALFALACASMACTTPPPLSPEAAHVAINDGRSIEGCATLGLVSAILPLSTITAEPELFLPPRLRDETAERGGNYVEAMPMQCSRGAPCAQSGIAYRCPASTARSI